MVIIVKIDDGNTIIIIIIIIIVIIINSLFQPGDFSVKSTTELVCAPKKCTQKVFPTCFPCIFHVKRKSKSP